MGLNFSLKQSDLKIDSSMFKKALGTVIHPNLVNNEIGVTDETAKATDYESQFTLTNSSLETTSNPVEVIGNTISTFLSDTQATILSGINSLSTAISNAINIDQITSSVPITGDSLGAAGATVIGGISSLLDSSETETSSGATAEEKQAMMEKIAENYETDEERQKRIAKEKKAAVKEVREDAIDAYIAFAKGTAEDNIHGYSTANRGKAYEDESIDYDCSSLVWFSLLNAGFSRKILKSGNGGVFATPNMGKALTKLGFTKIKYNSNNLKAGDIVVDPRPGDLGHTVMIYSSGKNGVQQIAAHGNYDGETGDTGNTDDNSESGKEINISDFSEGTHQYKYIYRLSKDLTLNDLQKSGLLTEKQVNKIKTEIKNEKQPISDLTEELIENATK